MIDLWIIEARLASLVAELIQCFDKKQAAKEEYGFIDFLIISTTLKSLYDGTDEGWMLKYVRTRIVNQGKHRVTVAPPD